MERQQRFSIRKFKTAVGSALLATMMLGAPMLQAVNVLAQDQATHQHQLANTTNLVEAPKDMTELGQDFQAKAGTSEGQMVYSVASEELATVIKEAQKAGVTITQSNTVTYDSLEAAQADYQAQMAQIVDIIAKQTEAKRLYAEAVTKYKVYQAALTQYEKDQAAYNTYLQAKADYDVAFAAYQEAHKVYEAALAENVKQIAAYEKDKLGYDKAYSLYQDKLARYVDVTESNATKKAAYEAALAQYEKDYPIYLAALAKYQAAQTADANNQAQYAKNLEQYGKDKTQYDKKLVDYQNAVTEAQKNTGRDGYLSRVEAQELMMLSEPNATVTITGTAKFANKASVSNHTSYDNEWVSALYAIHSDAYYNAAGMSQANAWIVNGSDNGRKSEGYAMVAKEGDHIIATYENLQNFSVGSVKIAKAVYRYDVLETSDDQGYLNLVIYKDPTVTIDNDAQNDIKSKSVRLRLTPTYFDEQGNQIDLSKYSSLLSISSLNYDYYAGQVESVQNLNGLEFIYITGSSIVDTNGVIAATSNNSWSEAKPYYNGVSSLPVEDWDVSDHPNEYFGAGALKVTAKDFSFELVSSTYSEANDSQVGWKGYWQSITSNIRANGIVEKEPTPPTPPVPPVPVTTGNEPVEPPKVEEPQYETAEEPKPPVEPVKPVITEPKEPTAPTPPNEVPKPGEPEKVPEPKEPIPFEATFHKTAYAETPKPVKGITNEAGEDVTGQYIPKGSMVKFPITVPSLKAGRDVTKTFVIEDVVDEGVELDLEAVKKAYPGFDVSFDDNRLLKLVAKEDYLKEMNKDLTKAFDFTTPDLVGRVLNDGKTYTNTLKVTRNDYTSYSETVDVSTPGREDKSTTRDSLIEPTKTVRNASGEDWTGKPVLPGDLISYPNTWDNDQFKAIKDGDKDKHIHLYIEDIDGTKFTPQLDQFQAIDSDQEAVKGLKAIHVESVDKADKELQDYLKGSGLYDKIDGDFVALIPEDMMAFEEAYVKTGKVLTFNLVGTPKEGATGVLKNTSYQVSFGNGYKTSTVENPIQVTTEWVDKTTGKDLKDKVTGDKTESRGDFTNYRWVDTVPTKTGVKHLFERLYTTEWVDEQGKTLKDMVTDTTTKEKGTVPDHTWVDTVETESGIKHIFKKTPPAKSTTNSSKGSLPSTGDQAGSFIAYLGVLLVGLAIAWKTGLFRKIKALISR